MKKVFTAASIVAITLLSSCGGSETVGSEESAATEVDVYQETLKTQDEIDEIQLEIEEIEETEAELEDLENELDNI